MYAYCLEELLHYTKQSWMMCDAQLFMCVHQTTGAKNLSTEEISTQSI